MQNSHTQSASQHGAWQRSLQFMGIKSRNAAQTYNVSISKEKNIHVNVQMSTEGTPLSVMTIWCMFIPGVWTVAEFLNDIFVFRLPERLNASLRHCFLIPVDSCWSSRGLELPWPSLLPRRRLKADSQIRTLFFFCHSNEVCFHLIRGGSYPFGNMFHFVGEAIKPEFGFRP